MTSREYQIAEKMLSQIEKFHTNDAPSHRLEDAIIRYQNFLQACSCRDAGTRFDLPQGIGTANASGYECEVNQCLRTLREKDDQITVQEQVLKEISETVGKVGHNHWDVSKAVLELKTERDEAITKLAAGRKAFDTFLETFPMP